MLLSLVGPMFLAEYLDLSRDDLDLDLCLFISLHHNQSDQTEIIMK